MHPELHKLNQFLQKKGEDVILRRRVGTSTVFVSLPCRALVRGYRPEQLSGTNITQQDSEAILSPTPILAAGAAWPGAAGGPVWPRTGDQLIVKGAQKTAQVAGAIAIDDEVVRIEMQVRG